MGWTAQKALHTERAFPYKIKQSSWVVLDTNRGSCPAATNMCRRWMGTGIGVKWTQTITRSSFRHLKNNIADTNELGASSRIPK